MKLKQALQGLLCLSALVGVVQVMGADLSVAGRIQPNGACELTLLDGGAVDLGTLSASQVEKRPKAMVGGNSYPIIGEIRERLSIRCQDATRLALRALDNRSGTANERAPYYYGLGLSEGAKVGMFDLSADGWFGDGRRLASLQSWDSGATWSEIGFPGQFGGEVTLVAWAEPGQALPQAFETISGDLRGTVMASDQLDSGAVIDIDGSATLELLYL